MKKVELKKPPKKEKYWSMLPGKVVDPDTGSDLSNTSPHKGAPFYSLYEWNRTLADIIEDLAFKNGGTGFISTSRTPHTILERLPQFRPKFHTKLGDTESSFSHGEMCFRDSYLDPELKVKIYYDSDIPENTMHYVLEDGTYTAIHILDNCKE